MCRPCWTIVVLLLLAVSGMVYQFIFKGSVEPGTDGRTAIRLTPGERDLVLTEMRTFLSSVQAIAQGVSEQDMAHVARAAREVGAAAQQAMPASLVGKLPISFKKLGFDTHRKFDTLALDAEQLGDPEHALGQLSELMQNCVGCHSAYRFIASNQM